MALTKLPKDGLATGSVSTSQIEDGTIQNQEFENSTLTSAKLADSTIANAKLSNSSFTINGTSVNLGASITAEANVEWQSVVTSNTTMVAGRGYFVNTTSGAITMTLPSSASIGDTISIKDYAETFGTNSLTIARNSHKIQGATNNSVIDTNRASVTLVYVDATQGWIYTEEQNIGALGAPQYTAATGGTVTTSGNFKIHRFNSSSNFVVSSLGNAPSNPNGGPSNVDYLVVAGGGSAGGPGGGGGAGGLRTTFPSPSCNAGAFPISATTYPITVGAGASAPSTPIPASPSRNGTDGSNSTFSTITSTGGGGGGAGYVGSPPSANGRPGGSGGGGGNSEGPSSGGSGNTPPVSPSQGNNGGAGTSPSAGNRGPAGGGGHTSAGGNGVVPKGGDGGAGTTATIMGLGSGFTDSSPLGLTMTASGNTSHSEKNPKYSFSSIKFDGSGDKLVSATNSAFNLGTSNYTIEMYLKKAATMTNHSVGHTSEGNSEGHGFQIEYTSNKLGLYIWDLNNNWTFYNEENAEATVGTWYHYAWVRNGTSFKLYKDGTEQTATTTSSASITPTVNGWSFASHRSDSGRDFNGFMKRIRISNSARYTSNFTPSTTDFTTDANTLLLIQNDGDIPYAGGGGGSAGGTPGNIGNGTGGSGGGGDGGSYGSPNGESATANTGGGGGSSAGYAGSSETATGAGGSGVVIIRYKYQG